jgi:hypothetical protein
MTAPPAPEARVARLRRAYQGLSPRARGGVAALLAGELVLIAWTQRDIQRRPARQIRGPKPLWRAVATQNVVGPAAYLVVGRRR